MKFQNYQVRCKKCHEPHPKTESKYYEMTKVCNSCKMSKTQFNEYIKRSDIDEC